MMDKFLSKKHANAAIESNEKAWELSVHSKPQPCIDMKIA